MPDDRDKLVPKHHPTPTSGVTIRRTNPMGVPIATPAAVTIDARSHVEDLARRERAQRDELPDIADFEDTPVGSTPSITLHRMAVRTKHATKATYDVQARMHTLESNVAEIGKAYVALEASTRAVLDELKETRRERSERERRAETRAEAEDTRRHERKIRLILILASIVTIVGGILTGYLVGNRGG